MNAHLTHTTILVNCVDSVAEFFLKNSFHINSPDIFEGEGTREIYIGDFDKHSSKILLVEPYGNGPYQKALHKRGPGLHHIGVDVENLVEYCTSLGRSGWLLHTHSLISAPKHQTAYLVRPGVPLMIEAQQTRPKKRAPSLLNGISLPDTTKHQTMIEAIGIENAEFTYSTLDDIIFETLNGSFSLDEILRYDKKMK